MSLLLTGPSTSEDHPGMPQLGQGGWAMAGKSQRQRLPGSCNSAAGWDTRPLEGTSSLLPFPWPLLHLAGGHPASSMLAPCCPKPPEREWLEHPAAGSSSAVPSTPAGLWGCHSHGWLLESCQGLSRLGIPSCVGSALSPSPRGRPGRHLRGSAGNPRAGPYRTSHLARSPSLPCLGWLPGSTAGCQASLPGGLS